MKISRPISPILTIKFVVTATSLERSEKDGQIGNLRSNTYYTNGENLLKVGAMDPEIALLKGSLKNK